MNISLEKEEIIQRFRQVYDEHLIHAFKNLLDFAQAKPAAQQTTLDQSIQKGVRQAEEGAVRPHEQVMKELRNRYKA
jgi:phage-related protein